MPIHGNPRILLTGGTGFIGGVVLKSLIALHLRPLVTTRRISMTAFDPAIIGTFDVAELDLTDPVETKRIITDFEPEIVIHLAGATMHDDPTGDYCYEMNFAATASLFSLLRETDVKKAVMIGTGSEYGDQPAPFSEQMETRPVSVYAKSKADATNFALGLFERSGFPVTILRVFTAYGPGQPLNMFISQLVTHAIRNDHFNMSDGLQERDFVYVDDVADAILAAVTSDTATGRVVNIGSGQATALKDIAAMVWEECEADPEKLHIGAIAKTGDALLDTHADITLARDLLGWSPKTSLKTGISRTIAALKAAAAAIGDAQVPGL